jgi:GH3 auxin-responsive promoter
MGRLLRWAIAADEWRHRRAFEVAAEHPISAQARVLRRILADNATSAFGREHGFTTIATPADFVRRVPIRDYEALRPWISRSAAGEPRVLTAETPFMFTSTSGTTGEPKLVPVTTSWAATTAALMRLWTVHALRDHPTMLDGRVLALVSPTVEGATSGGLPYGAMTGLMFQRLPTLIRRRHAVPYTAALVRDHETRYFVAARLALGRSVTSIGMPNPSTLLRLADTASRRAEALVRAIHDGTLGIDDPEPTAQAGLDRRELHSALSVGLTPDPRRAALLAGIVECHGRLVLGECWPNLALLACWLGGSTGIQARHLDAHFDARVARRDLGLVASEALVTLPTHDGSAAGVLAVHSNFFEFVPEEEIEADAPRALLCHELEVGRRYYVIVTGGNGLYRYDLNDIVEVHGFWRRTPTVAFVRKGRDMLNITGEKLHLNHVVHAVRVAERTIGVGVWQFQVVPDIENARYDLLVELPRPVDDERALDDFVTAFDRALGAVNLEYASKRASARLHRPRLFVMRPGWSERICQADFARGRREAQHKWSAMAQALDDASRAEVVQSFDQAASPGDDARPVSAGRTPRAGDR